MVRTSVLADAMNSINNADRMGKRQVLVRPASKVTVEFLNIMQKHGKLGICCRVVGRVVIPGR
ncbi:hypothetical protein RRF57_011420 [Xylaria bambusicola]|uniref:40S ribosomal protein S15a n=1 Tax=Xylaria bambusicola TaxID=326684 RepID=A0AAN7ZE40_9PEZI